MGKSRQTGWALGLMLIILTAWSLPGTALDLPLNGKSWALWGTTRETSRLGREQTVARENYCPTGGCVIRLDRVSVKPLQARPGDTLLLSTSYTLLTPEQIAIPVSISREIFFQGKSLGKTKSTDTRTLNGTFDQEIDFKLPANAAPGNYTVVTVISTGYGQDQKKVDFRVE
ncbi:MAG: hypothetical protein HY743_10185 [Deltaproteobacteria bacterium]|nr:hypothetical protein [Deltaproteobacteria bacterium]